MALLKDLSRDANICQLYGASLVSKKPVKLVFEVMEVSRCGEAAQYFCSM